MDWNEISFLKIDDRDISLKQVLGYLQLSGKLEPFLQEIVSQHVVYQEILARTDLELKSADVEQAIIDFRLQQNLTDRDRFDKWLASKGSNYEAFQSQMAFGVKLQKLKSEIADPDLEAYFHERQRSLDRVDLSCAIMPDREMAAQLREKIASDDRDLDDVADASDRKVEVIRGPTLRQSLPAELRDKVDGVTPREIVGPLEIGQRWCLFQVKEIIPAVLEGQIKQELENELFKRWLVQKVKQLKVQFAVDS